MGKKVCYLYIVKPLTQGLMNEVVSHLIDEYSKVKLLCIP